MATSAASFSWTQDTKRGLFRKTIPTDTGEVFCIAARNVRDEKTGLHARLALFLGDRYLGHDEFDLARIEERQRLAKRSFGKLGDASKQTLTLALMGEEVDLMSLELEERFEHRHTGGLMGG